MEITVNVNINAPELSAAITGLAVAMSSSPVVKLASMTSIPLTQAPEQPEPSKSQFTVKLSDLKPVQDDAAQKTETPDPQPEPQKTETSPAQNTGVTDPDPKPTEQTPAVTLEQVRAKLAALSQAGKQAQVKELITKAGAKKLTEIPAGKYAELLAEAEKL